MLVPNQLIEVKVIGCTLQHYKDLGYDVKMFDTIMVPPEHLTSGSKAVVDVLCDICGDKMPRPYKKYIKSHTYGFDTCAKCKSNRTRQTCMNKYGADNPMRNKEIQEKMQCSIKIKYGVDNVSQSDDIKRKKIETFQERYGVDWAFASQDVRNNVKQTWLNKYGCENPMQNVQIKEKAVLTLCQNGSVPTSSQQMQIYEMVKKYYNNAQINYPYGLLALDVFVCINDVKIDIEYDGWFFHKDKLKDLRRDRFLRSNGIKVLRVRSGNLLPTEQELFDAMDYLVNTEHHFKEIILSDWKEKEAEECQKQLQAVL